MPTPPANIVAAKPIRISSGSTPSCAAKPAQTPPM
jgi:hypothetical protein